MSARCAASVALRCATSLRFQPGRVSAAALGRPAMEEALEGLIDGASAIVLRRTVERLRLRWKLISKLGVLTFVT